MKEYEVVVENSIEQKDVSQIVRSAIEEVVYTSVISNSIVFVIRTSYIHRLQQALHHTGLAFSIEEMSDDE